MRFRTSFLLQNAPQTVVQRIQIWAPGRPNFCSNKSFKISSKPTLCCLCLMRWGGALLEYPFCSNKQCMIPGFDNVFQDVLLIIYRSGFYSLLTKVQYTTYNSWSCPTRTTRGRPILGLSSTEHSSLNLLMHRYTNFLVVFNDFNKQTKTKNKSPR